LRLATLTSGGKKGNSEIIMARNVQKHLVRVGNESIKMKTGDEKGGGEKREPNQKNRLDHDSE